MADFAIRTPDTAPEKAKTTLAQVQKKFGFIPNILAIMSNAPALLKGYVAVSEAFEESSLSPTEQTVVLMGASFENSCNY